MRVSSLIWIMVPRAALWLWRSGENRVTFISKKRGKQNSIFLILSVYCTQIVSFLWLWCLVLTKYLHLDKWHKISLKKTMISQENYFLLIKILSYWRFCPNYFLIFDHFWSFWQYAWKIWTNWQSCCLWTLLLSNSLIQNMSFEFEFCLNTWSFRA